MIYNTVEAQRLSCTAERFLGPSLRKEFSSKTGTQIVILENIEVRLRRDCLKEWSGLSESNRHLNLGKVPYYHYTKAAYLTFLLYHADATSHKARRTGLFLTA